MSMCVICLRLQQFTLFLRLIVPHPHPNATCRSGMEKKTKGRGWGVSIMQCDMSCQITTSNITSFNLLQHKY